MKKKWYFDLRMKQKNDPRRWALTKTIWRKGDWKILRYFRDMNSCLPETSWHYRNLRYEVTCWERGEFKWVILPRKHFDRYCKVSVSSKCEHLYCNLFDCSLPARIISDLVAIICSLWDNLFCRWPVSFTLSVRNPVLLLCPFGNLFYCLFG